MNHLVSIGRTLYMAPNATDARPLVLVALCGGGWHPETCRILEQLPAGEFRFAYAYGHHSGVHGAARLSVPVDGPRYPVHYLGPTRPHPGRFIANPARFMVSLVEALRLVRKVRPSAVLALGSAIAIPLFIAARLVRVPCVFVESLTRVERLSLTGRIIRRLSLADRLYVQWPALRDRLPGTHYAGAVL
jgi:UDP-N-acetylglucosamine:LPS N-acetylglucosamine transferase